LPLSSCRRHGALHRLRILLHRALMLRPYAADELPRASVSLFSFVFFIVIKEIQFPVIGIM
jgi:hypothetical protein